jgi:hypothetical protein
VAPLPSRETLPTASEQRCPKCDADVLFLSTCPHCGTRIRELGLPLNVLPFGAPPARGTPAAQTNQRVPRKSGIPDELIRAWDRPAQAPSRKAVKARDEFALGNGRSSVSHAVRNRGLKVFLGAAVAIGAVAAGAMALNGHKSSPPAQAASTPVQFSATVSQLNFQETFPATPTVLHTPARFDGRPYVVTSYSANAGTNDLIVSVLPFPVGKPPKTGAYKFLKGFVAHQNIVPNAGRLHAGRATRVEGLPSAWLAATANGGNWALFGVIILDGHVAWEVLEIGPATSVTSNFQQALKSFLIANPRKSFVKI